MRFLHTADWHLGRLLHGAPLIEDQAYALDQLVRLAEESRVEAVVVAGDVYDRAVPPADAVELLDETLSRLVLGSGVSTILIAGNHDSSPRLGFCSRLLEARRLHVRAALSREPAPVTIEDSHGPVHFHPVPYAEPPVVAAALGGDRIRDHDSAMRRIVECLRGSGASAVRSVLVAHAFVVGAEESESERPLSIGGVATVGADCFDGFHYVALGHLHRPQSAGGERIRYAGSLLKYSFSEADHKKAVHIVELERSGACRIEPVRLAVRRDLRVLEGTLTDLLRGPGPRESPEDYIAVRLLDRGVVFDAMGKLRDLYPNVLHIERPAFTPETGDGSPRIDPQKTSDADLFRAFYRDVTGEELPAEHVGVFTSAVDELRQRDMEATP